MIKYISKANVQIFESGKDALYYSEFKVCSKCGVIYYTTHPSSEKCRGDK